MDKASRSPFGFGNWVEEAGLGSLMWEWRSYLAATHYHAIVALFTAAILFIGLIELVPWPITAACTGLYGLYFFGRTRLSPDTERRFYRSRVQLIRAQVSFACVTVLVALVPGADRSLLWLLYVPLIMLVSRHCRTGALIAFTIQSAATLFFLRLYHGAPPSPLIQFIETNIDLVEKGLWLGLLAFILHYLVRNIDARNQNIAAYNAVNALARDVDMSNADGSKQWQPILITLVKHLEGQCASTWIIDRKTRQLRLLASVQRGETSKSIFCLIDEATGITQSLNDESLIAQVARSGRSASVILLKPADGELGCPGCNSFCNHTCAELAVPINVGADDPRSTVGILSVGFRAESFRECLLPDYENFMQGLVDQAKPMLAYAQRLGELEALQTISRQVTHSLDLNEVLDGILQAAVNALGFEFATISLVDEEQRLIRCVRGLNVPQEWIDMAVHSLDSDDIQADIVRTRKTEVLTGWDPRFDKRIWSKFGHQDMIRVWMPLDVIDAETRQERAIGTIEAGYRQATFFEVSPDQMRMLEALKNQASIAIEHAKLMQRTRKKADILTSLHQVGQVIGSARETEQVLSEIARNALTLLDADSVMVYRYHRDTQIVDPPVIEGRLNGKFRPDLNLNETNILTQLLNETRPYYSPDAQRDPDLVIYARIEEHRKSPRAKPTFIQRQNIKSFAGIPLIVGGETVGIMFVNYRRRHDFDLDEQRVHELFAQQAAIALKNAEMNELMRDAVIREERNRLSRELHHSVSQALFGIKLNAQNAMKHIGVDDAALRVELTNILDIAHVASNETGFIIDELRAPIDEPHSLERGLTEYAQRVSKWYSLDVVLEHDTCRPLPPRCEQTLMHFAREAINNAARHARGATITVRCEVVGNRIEMSVSDDGIGFDPDRVQPTKLGLKSMQELATSVGGRFELQTAPGKGTTVSLTVYIEEGGTDDCGVA